MKNNETQSVIERVYRDDIPSLSDIEFLLNLQDEDDMRMLFDFAETVRNKFCGDGILVRAILEFSSYCKNTCMYCGLNRHNKSIKRYRISKNQIMDAVECVVRAGIRTVVLQSGEDELLDTDSLAEIIAEIKQSYDIAVTLSAGEQSFETYKLWKEAGADRYLLKIETSNKSLYESLHIGMSYENRLECSRNLKLLGYQNGSGCIVGLKGQTTKNLAEDILFFKKEEFDMIGIGLFIPHEKTPLKNRPLGNLKLALKTIAITRIVTKNTHLPATTSIGNIGREDKRFRALTAGANVIMLNFTPIRYRELYSIYPSKGNNNENFSEYLQTLRSRAKMINRWIDYSKGDSLKFEQISDVHR